MNKEQKLWWYFAHDQDGLNLRIFRMFEGTFSLKAAYIYQAVNVTGLPSLHTNVRSLLLVDSDVKPVVRQDKKLLIVVNVM